MTADERIDERRFTGARGAFHQQRFEWGGHFVVEMAKAAAA